MRSVLEKTPAIAVGLLAAATALAHPGEHAAEGIMQTLAHLLGEHGYLLMLLMAVGLLAWRRAQRD